MKKISKFVETYSILLSILGIILAFIVYKFYNNEATKKAKEYCVWDPAVRNAPTEKIANSVFDACVSRKKKIYR